MVGGGGGVSADTKPIAIVLHDGVAQGTVNLAEIIVNSMCMHVCVCACVYVHACMCVCAGRGGEGYVFVCGGGAWVHV